MIACIEVQRACIHRVGNIASFYVSNPDFFNVCLSLPDILNMPWDDSRWEERGCDQQWKIENIIYGLDSLVQDLSAVPNEAAADDHFSTLFDGQCVVLGIGSIQILKHFPTLNVP